MYIVKKSSDYRTKPISVQLVDPRSGAVVASATGAQAMCDLGVGVCNFALARQMNSGYAETGYWLGYVYFSLMRFTSDDGKVMARLVEPYPHGIEVLDLDSYVDAVYANVLGETTTRGATTTGSTCSFAKS